MGTGSCCGADHDCFDFSSHLVRLYLTMATVEARGLQKSFGDVNALRGVSLSVEEGEILGVLGPNGAGKTTTINILTTLLRPTPARCASPGSTSSPTPPRSARSSASPVSSRTRRCADRAREPDPVWPPVQTRQGRGDSAPPNSTNSTSPMPPTAAPRPFPAACAGAWTSRRR